MPWLGDVYPCLFARLVNRVPNRNKRIFFRSLHQIGRISNICDREKPYLYVSYQIMMIYCVAAIWR